MSAYACSACDGANPVTILLTSLTNGETTPSCDQDLPLMLIGTLAQWLDLDPQRLYDSIQRFADREAKAAAKAAGTDGTEQAASAATPEPAGPPAPPVGDSDPLGQLEDPEALRALAEGAKS